MVTKHLFFSACCDGCEHGFCARNDFQNCYADEETLRNQMIEANWQAYGAACFCESCFTLYRKVNLLIKGLELEESCNEVLNSKK